MMTSSKTTPIALVLAGILSSLCHGAEPESKIELEFVYGTAPVGYTREKTPQPTILPTHRASFSLEWYHRTPVPPDMNAVLQTTVGRSVSQLQLEFIKTTGDITSVNAAARSSGNLLGIQFTSGRIAYELHAVSREDARKMAEAFVEVWLRENNAALKPLLDEYLGKFQNRRKELQQEIANAQRQIPEREQQLKDLQAQFAELKKKHYYQSPEQAQKAIEELNTLLNTERIELVGLLARRKAIERHRRDIEQKIRSKASSLIASWEPILLSLEQKYIDLLIDLDVSRAREEMALKLRAQAQGFLDLFENVGQVGAELAGLQDGLSRANANLAAVDQMLDEPRGPMLPLQVHKNLVSIRPVTVKFAE